MRGVWLWAQLAVVMVACVCMGATSGHPPPPPATLDQGDIWWSLGEGSFLCILLGLNTGGELIWRVLDRGRKASRRI